MQAMLHPARLNARTIPELRSYPVALAQMVFENRYHDKRRCLALGLRYHTLEFEARRQFLVELTRLQEERDAQKLYAQSMAGAA